MRLSLTKFTAGLACLAALTTVTYADYSSSGNNYPPPAPSTVVSSGEDIPLAPPSITSSSYRHHHRDTAYEGRHQTQPFWIGMHRGEPIPTNAVVGGSEYRSNSALYVCRANYRGGVHPGKFIGGNCNISWGGREVSLQRYEILVSDTPLAWVESSNGAIPHHAFEAGREHHHKLYICQAEYENGTHPGKIIGKNCNFGWGGREVMTPYYSVLTN